MPIDDPDVDPAGVAGERAARVLAALADAALAPVPGPLCHAAVALLEVRGAAVSRQTQGLPERSLCASDGVAARLEAIQAAVGEGPGKDAHNHGRPVLESDLSASPGRWPAFTALALESGARAVFAFPLRIGAIHVGVLGSYRTDPGPLSDRCFGDALVLAEAAAQLLLGISAPAAGDPAGLLGLVTMRSEIHQATGMVAVQLGVGIGDALVRMQAHALAERRLIGEVAADVLAGRLRFDGVR